MVATYRALCTYIIHVQHRVKKVFNSRERERVRERKREREQERERDREK